MEVTQEILREWYVLKEQLDQIKAREMQLRLAIYRHYFQNPVEGTNTLPLEDGTGAVIKGVHKIDRKVDEASLAALRQQINEDPATPRVSLDKLVRWKPELSVSEYRKLTAEEQQFFDQCLIVKEGAPGLEITIPKRQS